jgi:preprotein translocase subunit SecY
LSNALTLSAILGIAIIVWILVLYRRGKLKENYALFWILISLTIALISTFQDLLVWANLVLQAGSTTWVVLTSFIFLLIVVSIYYSVKISELTEQNKRIAQALALLQNYINGQSGNKERKKGMKRIIDQLTRET